MDENEINQIADKLESLTHGEAETLHITETGPRGFLLVRGNQAGLIQLAACCLRTAAAEIMEDCSSRPIQLNRSVEQRNPESKQTYFFGLLQRVENFPDYQIELENRKQRARTTDTWMLLGCSLIVFLFLMPFVIGVGVILSAAFGGG